jgi:hypothetical protein
MTLSAASAIDPASRIPPHFTGDGINGILASKYTAGGPTENHLTGWGKSRSEPIHDLRFIHETTVLRQLALMHLIVKMQVSIHQYRATEGDTTPQR